MKIEKIKEMLDENSSMIGGVQEKTTFSIYQLGKIRELQKLLAEKYGIQRKADAISTAVIYMLEGAKKDVKE